MCDFLRAAYTTRLRPFKGSTEEVTIRWYRCPEDTPVLPFPSAITSLNWCPRPEEITGVGEVWTAPRPFSPGTPIPGVPAGHICGTPEEFEDGEVLDVSRPPTVYDQDGLPTCCRPGGGGVLVGGEAPHAAIQIEPHNNCSTAWDADLGEQVGAGIHSGGHQWWRVPITAGLTYHVAYSTPVSVPGGTFAAIYQGDECDGLTVVGTMSAAGCVTLPTTSPDGGYLYFDFFGNALGIPWWYVIEVEAGVCP